MEDEQLVEAARKGSDEAFEQLYRRHVQPMFRFVLLQIGDYQRAEEVTQDIFLNVVKGLNRFRGESRFQTWLYTIARNRITDELRRLKKKRQVQLMTQEHLSLLEGNEYAESVEERVLQQEQQSALLQCMQELSEDHREVILLVDLQGFSLREAGRVLQRSEKAVKSLHFRALKKLREQVESGVDLYGEG